MSEEKTQWSRGGKKHVLDTYALLHADKIGMHWMWAAIERMAAGEPELEVLKDFGYVPVRNGLKR